MAMKDEAGKSGTVVKAFSEYLATLSLGAAERHENLTVIPVFTTAPQQNGYSLLDEAVRTGLFTVTEVTEGGSVPDLKVVNGLEQDVLILDNDILVGAKQNRSATTTIIINRKSESVISVNCVEQGRWSYKGRSFSASDRPVYSRLRAIKSRSVTENLNSSRSYDADQGAVWNDIEEKAVRFSQSEPNFCRSSTGAADEMYGSLEDKVKLYEPAFTRKEGQVGFVVLIGGAVAGCDIFGHPNVLSRVYAKGLRSYLLDAVEQASDREKKQAAGNPGKKAAAFLASIRKMPAEAFPSIGKGVNIRFRSRSASGFAALDGDQVVHLAAFRG